MLHVGDVWADTIDSASLAGSNTECHLPTGPMPSMPPKMLGIMKHVNKKQGVSYDEGANAV
jgi:hypothetical protein